jgi:hypothetical protein
MKRASGSVLLQLPHLSTVPQHLALSASDVSDQCVLIRSPDHGEIDSHMIWIAFMLSL